MKIVTILGARPQFIKAVRVSRVLSGNGVQEILVHTGQHYDRQMSEVFFEELEIPKPHYNLGIGSGTHGAQTGRMLEAIEQVLFKERPNWLLVYGDTNSTLAGTLAAVKMHIPVAHVEAGLRSFNRQMPEEINRVLSDRASDLLFAPTELAVENLRREGIHQGKIHLVGDVMYDAALYYGAKATANSSILKHLSLESKGYILTTIHRAENTDDPIRLHAIFTGLIEVSQTISVVVPLHPRTRKALERENILSRVSQYLQIVEPVGYLDMVMLEKNARLIATDSGGVQKEAFFYQIPCLTLREETEWLELVEMGCNCLVPPFNASLIRMEILAALESKNVVKPFKNLYGTGKTGEAIAKIISQTKL